MYLEGMLTEPDYDVLQRYEARSAMYQLAVEYHVCYDEDCTSPLNLAKPIKEEIAKRLELLF
jgi:hypothetical protein